MCVLVFLYNGNHNELVYCPKCEHPRYKEDTEAHLTNRIQAGKKNDNYNHLTRDKNTPLKVYRYFPITPRLKQLFNHRYFSKLFDYGDKSAEKKPRDVMMDIHHAPIWEKLHKDLPLYNADKTEGVCDKRVAFILSADGASMSSFQAADFSLTPILLSILNYPIGVRIKPQQMLVTGITPKNNKNTSIYLGIY